MLCSTWTAPIGINLYKLTVVSTLITSLLKFTSFRSSRHSLRHGPIGQSSPPLVGSYLFECHFCYLTFKDHVNHWNQRFSCSHVVIFKINLLDVLQTIERKSPVFQYRLDEFYFLIFIFFLSPVFCPIPTSFASWLTVIHFITPLVKSCNFFVRNLWSI